MIRFGCPRCKQVLEAPDDRGGSKVACPTCQQRLQIPMPPPNKTVLAPLVPVPPQLPASAPVPVQLVAPPPAPKLTVLPPPPELPFRSAQWQQPKQHGPIYVRLSARIVDWPQVCACCASPADSAMPVSHVRVTGVRVIREHERTWEVPYCLRCHAHVAAAARLPSGEPAAVSPAVVLGGLIGGGVAASLLMLAVGCLHSLAVGLLLGILAGGVVALVAVGTYPGVRQRYAWAAWQAQQERAKAVAELDSLMRSSCCTVGVAVRYLGWHGTVHTFCFENEGYAASFREANRSKCV